MTLSHHRKTWWRRHGVGLLLSSVLSTSRVVQSDPTRRYSSEGGCRLHARRRAHVGRKITGGYLGAAASRSQNWRDTVSQGPRSPQLGYLKEHPENLKVKPIKWLQCSR